MRRIRGGAILGLGVFLGWGASAVQAMGRVPRKEYDAKVAELSQLKDACAAERDDAKGKVQSLEQANAQLLKDMDSSKSELQKRLADLLREKQDIEKEKSTEMEKMKGTYDSLVSDMKKEIEQGTIQITQLQNKLSVNLVDKILFDSGEAAVNEQGQQVLKKVANILKKVQNKQIRIEGHTDNVPIGGSLKDLFPSNWELSTARATHVARYLQETGGVDPRVLYAAGYAEFRPIADNSTSEGRAKNRRIEIALVPLETASASSNPAGKAPPAPPAKPK